MAIETLLTPEYIERHTAAGFWQNKLITDYLDAAVQRNPDKEAIVDRWGRLTYGKLDQLADRVAMGLLELGLGPGDITALQLPNWHQFAVFHVALTRIGAITSNVPHIFRHHEMSYVLGFTEAKALVIPAQFRNFDYRAMVQELRPQLPRLKHVFVIGDEAPAGMISYEEFIETPWERRRDRAALSGLLPEPNAVTQIAFTSGTTGEPKGVMHTSNTLGTQIATLNWAYDMGEDDVIFMASPVGHHTGFLVAVRQPITLGCKAVYQEQWLPAEGIALMAEEGVTFTLSATTFLQDVVYSPDLARYDHLPLLRAFITGGAPVPSKMLADARERLPHTFVAALFGMTENGPITLVPPGAPVAKVVDSDGCACPAAEIKIIGPDGQEVPRGTDGELVLRSAQQTVGYYGRPDANAAAYMPDGFFHTGDQARMDEDGYIRITGRIKDLIIRGGENISPVEIEGILFAHPKVANVAVVGMPDARLGERICAYIVPREGETISIEEVVAWMAEAGVAKPKWPQRLEVVDALPRTPAGKVQKFVLRQWITAKLAAEGGEAAKQG